MNIRFGYIAMSAILENASPPKSVTVKSYSALAEKDRGGRF
jgi:UV DNA damage repair endonuclease